jgi:hypothetical protein
VHFVLRRNADEIENNQSLQEMINNGPVWLDGYLRQFEVAALNHRFLTAFRKVGYNWPETRNSFREPLIKFGYTLGSPSEAKARVHFAALAARLKSCPDTKPT